MEDLNPGAKAFGRYLEDKVGDCIAKKIRESQHDFADKLSGQTDIQVNGYLVGDKVKAIFKVLFEPNCPNLYL